MTKKDYIALARAIHESAQTDQRSFNGAGVGAILSTARRIADVLAQDSPRFDHARFIEACETGSDKRAASVARKASKAALAAQRAEVSRG